MWCVRQTSPRLPVLQRSRRWRGRTPRGRRRSAPATSCGCSSGAWKSRPTTRSARKSMNASALASRSSRLRTTSAYSSTSRSPQVSGSVLAARSRMRAQRVEVDAVGLAGGVVPHVCRTAWATSRAGRRARGLRRQRRRLVEEAEVRALHVEAERRHRPLVRRERLEDAGEEELHRARLGGQARHAGDVEVRRLGTEQEIGVEIHRGGQPGGAIGADRNAGATVAAGVAVHPERDAHVGVGGHAGPRPAAPAGAAPPGPGGGRRRCRAGFRRRPPRP